MSYEEVMALPVKTFWLMSGNIRRIRAESDLRGLMVAAVAQSSEAIKDYQEKLILEMGVVVKAPAAADIERDEKGFADLKAMAQAM